MRLIENPSSPSSPTLPSSSHESPAAKPVAVLEVPYERQAPWTARRGAFYLIVLLLMLNVVATTSITWGPIVMKSVRERLEARRAAALAAKTAALEAAAAQASIAQRQSVFAQCLATTIPTGQVIYTEDPAEAARLIEGQLGYSCVHTGSGGMEPRLPHLPILWNGPTKLAKTTNDLPGVSDVAGSVYIHERHAPDGQPRLVWFRVNAYQDFETRSLDSDRFQTVLKPGRALEAIVFEAPGANGSGGALWSYSLRIMQPASKRAIIEYAQTGSAEEAKAKNRVVQAPAVLRILTGRSDPADSSHMTIDYTLDGKAGVIEVWLRPDDRLRVEVDQGKKATEIFSTNQGVEAWDPHARE